MSRQCVFIALSNQKGGVGKSTMTVLLASYFHYVMGKRVAVVDCDYPQFSIQSLRTRDMQNVEKSEYLQRMLYEQHERTGQKAYPVLASGPDKVLETALRLADTCDVVFFDLPGTVNSPGVLETIINMDYLFTPVVQDRMVMQSSLSFVGTLQDFIRRYPKAPLKAIRLFWNKIDGRVSREVYRHYNSIFGKIGLQTLDTVMPDMERYNKEASAGGRLLFRSTFFPPSEKLLKGSNLDMLAGEIESVIYPKVQES
ncbi:ParA family protein [uncultured Bacteroides sp.]|uniref:ParA family protein n=1 Tax=uncultured Bacteroides sp. TaxID=162156 RepID=UPI000822A561|nr:ParA family protein [uncultured Bacteroides sp.]SCI25946.1 CO dehydrogenase maturation factor [uncultured Bacteroides sp.]